MWKADADAKVILDLLTVNEKEHADEKTAAAKARTASLDTWITGDKAADGFALVSAKTANAAAVYATKTNTALATEKFSVGNITIRKVDASATGVAEAMRKCSSVGIGNLANNTGTVWNLGSHNKADGTANTAADSAKEYKDNYLDCDSP